MIQYIAIPSHITHGNHVYEKQKKEPENEKANGEPTQNTNNTYAYGKPQWHNQKMARQAIFTQ